MKKIAIAAMTAFLAFALFACGGEQTAGEPAPIDKLTEHMIGENPDGAAFASLSEQSENGIATIAIDGKKATIHIAQEGPSDNGISMSASIIINADAETGKGDFQYDVSLKIENESVTTTCKGEFDSASVTPDSSFTVTDISNSQNFDVSVTEQLQKSIDGTIHKVLGRTSEYIESTGTGASLADLGFTSYAA